MKKLILPFLVSSTAIYAQLATPNGEIQNTINSNTGNIGIGTNDPQSKLEIRGDLKINSGGVHTGILLGQRNNDRIIVDNSFEKHYGGGYFFRVHNEQAPSQYIDALLISESGNIGVGAFNPQSKLEVKGDLRVNGGGVHTGIILGQRDNDRIIADNSVEKHYGGGYFFRVHNEQSPYKYIDALLISENGNIVVSNKLEAKEIKVTNSPTADFVFNKDYNLPSLSSVEKHIQEKKHLPEIASAKEMEKEGVNVGEFQIKLLQKIEELTLYIIEQNKINQDQALELKNLKQEINQLKK